MGIFMLSDFALIGFNWRPAIHVVGFCFDRFKLSAQNIAASGGSARFQAASAASAASAAAADGLSEPAMTYNFVKRIDQKNKK